MIRIKRCILLGNELGEEQYCIDNQNNKQGLYESYYENGQLAVRCFYKDNKKDGPFEEYFDDGVLLETCVYRDGKPLFGKEGSDYLKVWQGKMTPIQRANTKFWDFLSRTHER